MPIEPTEIYQEPEPPIYVYHYNDCVIIRQKKKEIVLNPVILWQLVRELLDIIEFRAEV